MTKNTKNIDSAYDSYDYGEETLTSEQTRELLSMEFLSASDIEEKCAKEAESYDFDSTVYVDGDISVAGFYLAHQLQNEPLVRQSQSMSKEEKSKRMAELRDIYVSPTSTQKEKEDAAFKAMCYLYAFVRTLVKRYCSGYITPAMTQEDYIQVALLAVSTNLGGYQDNLAITSYFYHYIQHALIEQIALQQGVSRHYNQEMTKIRKVYRALLSEGKVPQVADIEYLLPKMSPTTIQKCLEYISVSFVDYEAAETVVSQTLRPDEEFEKKEDADLVRAKLKLLTEDEQKVMAYAYELGNYPKLSQINISNVLGLSVDQVRKLKISAERKLRRELSKHGYCDTARKQNEKNNKDKISSTLTFVPLMNDNSDLMSIDFSDDTDN